MDNTSVRQMKAFLLKLFHPFLLWLFRDILTSLKTACISENVELCSVLRGYGFHPAICNHPSILFDHKQVVDSVNLIWCSAKVSLLKKCIKLGMNKDEVGRKVMEKLGMPAYFENGVNPWFVDNHSAIMLYSIPDDPKPVGRIVVYSALTGNYDKVNEILYKEPGIDYLLLTNNTSLVSNTWEVVPIKSDLNDLLLSREIKMFPHKYLDDKYDISIYIDANAIIYGEITQLCRYLGKQASFAVSRHSVRNTVREEFDACVRFGKTDRIQAEKQYEQYVKEGFLDNKALLECSVLVRKHRDGNLQLLMQEWFYAFENGIRRDQLSLLPCISRLNYKDYVEMDGSTWHNQFFRLVNHK